MLLGAGYFIYIHIYVCVCGGGGMCLKDLMQKMEGFDVFIGWSVGFSDLDKRWGRFERKQDQF